VTPGSFHAYGEEYAAETVDSRRDVRAWREPRWCVGGWIESPGLEG
jgi:hypothetical protein